ncbi:MAG: hypothetical protein ACRC37_03435, partial [Lentisphaeria bacterium]
GAVKATGRAIMSNNVAVMVGKDGYHASGVGETNLTHNVLLNRWDPYPCEVTVKLKKIKDPVPMYAKHFQMSFPEKNKPIGLDLLVGDWVAPYGKGVVSDMLLTIASEPQPDTGTHNTLNIKFANPLDGIQEYLFDPNDQSVFKWPYLAPENGYESELNRFITYISDGSKGWYNKTDYMKNRNYLFRIRTQLDGNGKIISANYGYITEDFRFSIFEDKFRTIQFKYHFNPDSDSRSLEFNEKNLFPGYDAQGFKR